MRKILHLFRKRSKHKKIKSEGESDFTSVSGISGVKEKSKSDSEEAFYQFSDRCKKMVETLSGLNDDFSGIQKVFSGIHERIKVDDPTALKQIKACKTCIHTIIKIDQTVTEIKTILLKDYTKILPAFQKTILIQEELSLLEKEISFVPDDFSKVVFSYMDNIREGLDRFQDYIFKDLLEYDGIDVLAVECKQVLIDLDSILKIVGKKRFHDVITNEVYAKLDFVKERKLADSLPLVTKTIYQILDTAQCDVGTCFSKELDILSFYSATINMYLREWIGSLLENLSTINWEDHLSLLYWMRIDYPLVMEEFLVDNVTCLDFKKDVETLMDHFIVEKTSSILQCCSVAIKQDFNDPSCIVKTIDSIVMNSIIELFSMFNSEFDQLADSKNTRSDFLLQISKINSSSILLYISSIIDEIHLRVKTVSPLILYAYINTARLSREMLEKYIKRIKKFVKPEGKVDEIFSECFSSFSHLVSICSQTIAILCLEESILSFSHLFSSDWISSRTIGDTFGTTLDLFHKEDHWIIQEERGYVYRWILKMVVEKYVDEFMKRGVIERRYKGGKEFDDFLEDDIGQLGDLFACFMVENLDEELFPLLALKSFIKGIVSAEAVDMFVFSLHEFLNDFSYSWDAAEIIVGKCKWLKGEFKAAIVDSFKKDCKLIREPSPQNHLFTKYISKYNIYKEAEKLPIKEPTTVKEVVQSLKKIFSLPEKIEVIDLETFIDERL